MKTKLIIVTIILGAALAAYVSVPRQSQCQSPSSVSGHTGGRQHFGQTSGPSSSSPSNDTSNVISDSGEYPQPSHLPWSAGTL